MKHDIEIFRAGTHTTADGKKLTVTSAQIDDLVANYNESDNHNRAPLTIGHPKTNAPAFGWVDSLSRKGDLVVAKISDVSADVVDIVRNGHYKKISPSFRLTGEAGVPKLRHIGLLGAKAPSIKGLADVNFSEEDDDVVTFEFAEVNATTLKSILMNLRDWVISEKGIATADKILNNHDIQFVTYNTKDNNNFNYSERQEAMTDELPKPNDYDKLAESRAKLKADEEALAKSQADFAEAQEKQQVAMFNSNVETMVNAGTINPAQAKLIADFAETQTASFDFAEGDTIFGALQKFIADFAESAKAGTADFSESTANDAPEQEIADFSEALSSRAKEIVAQDSKNGVDTNPIDAVMRAKRELAHNG